MRSFKRKMVADETYERKLICYIHNNPVKDGFVRHAQDWHHSSFQELFKMGNHEWPGNEIIKKFGSKDDFLHAHIAELSPGSIDIKSSTIPEPPRVEYLYDRMKPGYPDDQEDWEVRQAAS